LTLTASELKRIEKALSNIEAKGARYSEAAQKMIDR